MSEQSVYRTPEERFRDLPGYPFAPHYVQVEGLRIHYVDEGQGEPVLLLHGEPTWSYLYRKMIPIIAARHRAIALDYVGFGKSDKWTEESHYTFEAHYRVLEAFVEALGLRDLTLVMQDWGGPLGLRLPAQHPERVARLVILNTWILAGDLEDPLFAGLRRWRAASTSWPDIEVARVIRAGTYNKALLTPKVLHAYEAPFPDRASRAGVRVFPRLIPTSVDDPLAQEMQRLEKMLRDWRKPTLIMFSDRDAVFPPGVGERLHSFIPGSQFEVIEGAAHFLQEEVGEELAERIVRWLAG